MLEYMKNPSIPQSLIVIDSSGIVISQNTTANEVHSLLLKKIRAEKVLSKDKIKEWRKIGNDQKEILKQNIYAVSFFDSEVNFALRFIGLSENEDFICEIINMPQFDHENSLVFELIDGAPFIAFIKDRNGKFVYGNRKLHEIYGTSHLVGKWDADFIGEGVESKSIREDDRFVLANYAHREIPHEKLTPRSGNETINVRTWKNYSSAKSVPGFLFGFAINIKDYIDEREFTRLLLSQAATSSFGDIAQMVCDFMARRPHFKDLIDIVAIVQNIDLENQKEHVIVAKSIVGDRGERDEDIQKKLNRVAVGKSWRPDLESSLWNQIKDGENFWAGDISDVKTVKLYHDWAKAISAVKIDDEKNGRIISTTDAGWGYICCASASIQQDQEMQRAAEELNYFADQIGRLLVICYHNYNSKQAESKMFSLYVESHEQDKRLESYLLPTLQRQIQEVELGGQFDISKIQYVYDGMNNLGSAIHVSRVISEFAQEYDQAGADASVALVQKRVSSSLKTINIEEFIKFIVREQEHLWQRKSNRVKLIKDIELDEDTIMHRIDDVLLASGIRNLINNSYSHVIKKFPKSNQEIIIRCRVRRGLGKTKSMSFRVSHKISSDQRTLDAIKWVNDFFTDIRKRPCDCPGWGSAVIKCAAIAHGGRARLTTKGSNDTLTGETSFTFPIA